MQKRYVSLNEYLGTNLCLTKEQAIYELMMAKQRGYYVRYDVSNDISFYSDEETEESLYYKLFGMSRIECEFYNDNRDEIITDLRKVARFFMQEDLYNTFLNKYCSKYSHIYVSYLMCIDYVFKIACGILSNEVNMIFMNRFNEFNNDQLSFCKDFIREYFNDEYQNLVLQALNISSQK